MTKGGISLDSKQEWDSNRESEAILYPFADGVKAVTLQDYLRENPNDTADDFKKWQHLITEMSHINYLNEEKEQRTEKKYKKYALANDLHTLTIRQEPFQILFERERKRLAIRAAQVLLKSEELSDANKRRFIRYFLHGESVTEIARTESVQKSSVSKSIHRLCKRLQNLKIV